MSDAFFKYYPTGTLFFLTSAYRLTSTISPHIITICERDISPPPSLIAGDPTSNRLGCFAVLPASTPLFCNATPTSKSRNRPRHSHCPIVGGPPEGAASYAIWPEDPSFVRLTPVSFITLLLVRRYGVTGIRGRARPQVCFYSPRFVEG